VLAWQWARDRRNAEREREEGAGDFGPEDYFDAAMRGGAHHRRGRGAGEGAAEGDEIGETLLLVLLCVSISILLYVRRRLVDRMRRDHEEAPQGEEQQVQRQVQRPVPPQPPPDQGEVAVAAAPAGGAGDVFRPDWPVQ
jgi:SEL1 protein